MASGYPVDILQRADDLVHLGQDYYLVGIAAGYYRVCQRIGVCQGLGLAVLTGILIGDDGGLYALKLDLLGVQDKVGIGVAEAFLIYDNAVNIQQAAEL